MGRFLGLDPGERRIGVAVSNGSGSMVFPRPYVLVDGTEMVVVSRLVHEEQIDAVVVGRPLNLQGARSPSTDRADLFAQAVTEVVAPIPVYRVDERFSTVTAQRQLHEAGVRSSEERSRIDSAAAAVMLEHFLDQQRG